MATKSASPDELVARVAGRQHGVVATQQLRRAGIHEPGVHHRLRSGRLHRIHRGVYAVGHPGLSLEGGWMAAVLACGKGAFLSHRSAAALWGLLPAVAGPVQVTIPGTGSRRMRKGIRIHRSRTLTQAQTTRLRNIPLTSPARTLADLRGSVSAADLRRATRQATVLGLPLGEDQIPDPTRSELEHRFLRLCRRHRIPAPEVNVPIHGFTVDFLWLEQRLVVETDGYRYHRGRQAFEDDRARDLQLRLRGIQVLRFSYMQVVEAPGAVAAAIRAALPS
jgi:very-short-patch-repair endonuclease